MSNIYSTGVALYNSGRFFIETLPAIGTTIFATAPGREVFYRFTLPLTILYGPKTSQTDFFISSSKAAGSIIDIHWLAQLFTLFTSRVGGFFRETGSDGIEKIYKIGEKLTQVDLRVAAEHFVTVCEDYEIKEEGATLSLKKRGDDVGYSPSDWQQALFKGKISDYRVIASDAGVTAYKVTLDQKVEAPKEEWFKAERWKWRKEEGPTKTKIVGGKEVPISPKIDLYPDIKGSKGEELPKRAGITPFTYYWTYNKVKAYALLFFTWATTQSIVSTYVPLFNQDFSLFAPLTSFVCSIGGNKVFTPQQWDSGLRLSWKKADTIALSAAYALQAYDAGRRLWNIKDDLGRSRVKECTKLVANLALSGLYGWMTVTGEDSPHVKMTAGALQLFLIATKELRKASNKAQRISLKLDEIVPRRGTTVARAGSALVPAATGTINVTGGPL